MRTEPPAPASPARTASDRLHVLLCHACAGGDLHTQEEVVAHALEALGTVLGASRGAIALVGSNDALTVAGSFGLSPQPLAAIEALPVGVPDRGSLLAALAPDGVEDVAVWPLPADAPRGAPQGAGYEGDGAPRGAPRGAGYEGDGGPQGAGYEGLVGLMIACYDVPQICDEDDRRMAGILAAQVAADVSRQRSGVVDRLSHAQLRAVLDATGEGIIARDTDGRLLWANREAARVLGMSSVEELLATPIDEVWAPFDVFDAAGRPGAADSCPGRQGRGRAVCHADPAKAELGSRVESYPLRGEEMLSRSLREGRSVVGRDVTEEHLRAAAANEEHYALMKELNIRSVMMVPIRARERTVGLILLVSAESGRRYGPDDALLVEDVAHRAGLAIDNARLFEEERRARSLAEQTRSEMALLLDVSQVLSSSLNYEEGLDRLARVASSTLCDLCLIDLLDSQDGSIRRVAAPAASVDRQPLADMLRGKYPPDPRGQHPAVRVMQTGQPEWASEMEEGFLTATTRDAEHRRGAQGTGVRSH